jgi:hypothetical protein
VCSHLIGRRYTFGKDDCIHLVVEVLQELGKNPPAVAAHWYELTPRQLVSEIKAYCMPIDRPEYDGDIVLLAAAPPTFGVLWQRGILFINPLTLTVDWKPPANLTIRRSYRMKSR